MKIKKHLRHIRTKLKFKCRIRAENEEEAQERIRELIGDWLGDEHESFDDLADTLLESTTMGMTGHWFDPDFTEDRIEGTLSWTNRKKGPRHSSEIQIRTDYVARDVRTRTVLRDSRGRFSSLGKPTIVTQKTFRDSRGRFTKGY